LKPIQRFYSGNREVEETLGACGVAVLLRFDRLRHEYLELDQCPSSTGDSAKLLQRWQIRCSLRDLSPQFSPRVSSSTRLQAIVLLTHVEDKIEVRCEALRRFGYSHHQLAPE
jgi:hypothetical protein